MDNESGVKLTQHMRDQESLIYFEPQMKLFVKSSKISGKEWSGALFNTILLDSTMSSANNVLILQSNTNFACTVPFKEVSGRLFDSVSLVFIKALMYLGTLNTIILNNSE